MIIPFIWFAHFIDYLYRVLPKLCFLLMAVQKINLYDLVDIKATNCIVVAHLTKLAIPIFSW